LAENDWVAYEHVARFYNVYHEYKAEVNRKDSSGIFSDYLSTEGCRKIEELWDDLDTLRTEINDLVTKRVLDIIATEERRRRKELEKELARQKRREAREARKAREAGLSGSNK